MHIHNVADYAPDRWRLVRTEYEAGATRHVFADSEGEERVCVVKASSADEERQQLERFRAEHALLVSTPVPAAEALGALAAAHAGPQTDPTSWEEAESA